MKARMKTYRMDWDRNENDFRMVKLLELWPSIGKRTNTKKIRSAADLERCLELNDLDKDWSCGRVSCLIDEIDA